METDAQPAADPPKDRKTYNGIEHFPNMQMGLAHYRTLDVGERGCTSHVVTRAREKRSGRPAMLREQHEEHQRSHHTFRRKGWCGKGRWLQVDPKSEKFYALTPYNSMGGNPLSMVDPDGDEIITVMLIGAAVGVFGNGLSNAYNGQDFFDGAGKAALWGSVGAAASFGIGAAAGGLFGQGASFGKAAFQFGAHGVSNGLQSHFQGGSFGQGFLSGGIGSGISSGVHALGGGAGGQILGGGLGGGIGVEISEGDFFKGFTQGVIVGGFNHALHSGLSGGPGDPPTKEELLDWLADEWKAGNITPREYENAWVLVEEGGWGLVKHVLWNHKTDIALSMVPGGGFIKGGSKILVKGSKNLVDISKFSNGKYKSWRLVKDYAAGKNTAHGGSYWKLYNTADRSYKYHTLTKSGKYLRTKK